MPSQSGDLSYSLLSDLQHHFPGDPVTSDYWWWHRNSWHRPGPCPWLVTEANTKWRRVATGGVLWHWGVLISHWPLWRQIILSPSESQQGLKLDTMRQKENLETFLESLLLSEDQFKTDAGGHTHTSLPPLSHIQRSVYAMPENIKYKRLVCLQISNVSLAGGSLWGHSLTPGNSGHHRDKNTSCQS